MGCEHELAEPFEVRSGECVNALAHPLDLGDNMSRPPGETGRQVREQALELVQAYITIRRDGRLDLRETAQGFAAFLMTPVELRRTQATLDSGVEHYDSNADGHRDLTSLEALAVDEKGVTGSGAR